jgi:hypothetical protein
MKEYNFTISASTEVPLGGFIVARIKPKAIGEKLLGPKDIEEIYHGDSGKSSLLFGWGIARNISDKGGVPLLIFNPDEEIVVPDTCEEDND